MAHTEIVDSRYTKISAKDKEYVSSLMKKCELGDVWAMEQLATFYYEEHPKLMNDSTSQLVLDYYEKAVSIGHQRACLNLGKLYYDGLYVKQDYAKAIELFKSAISGDSARIAAIADSKLGDCYYYGNGVEIDYSKAFDCYLEGVLLCDYPICLCKLGDMYRTGMFVNQDSKKAYFIYCKAKKISSQHFCDDGYAEILIRIAEAKIEGDGTDRDIPGALKYLEIAKRIPNKRSCSEDILQREESLRKKAKEVSEK